MNTQKKTASQSPGKFRAVWLLISLLLVASWVVQSMAAPDEQVTKKVFVVPIAGDVEPSLAAYIERALRDSHTQDALYVFEIDTFGGRVDAALQIVDTLLDIQHGQTIAFVQGKAISAGALIALSCQKLVMRPSTTIGDCAPISFSEEGPKMLGEKFQSPLRAKFRTLARRNNYPIKLSESMVTAEMEVIQIERDGEILYLDAQEYADLSEDEKKGITSKKTVVEKGELLTMDNVEALNLGFSSMTAQSIEEMLQELGVVDYDLVRMEQSWSEDFGRLIVKISPILMMIGLAALYMELKAPGFGIPGIIGILCLGLVFFNQYLVGLADHTELIIILLGIVLLGMEVFVIPGFGIAGIGGFFCIAVGLILSFQDFVIPDPQLPWQADILLSNTMVVLGSFLFAFFCTLLFLRYIFPQLGRVVEGPYLATTLSSSHVAKEQNDKPKVGERGEAITLLRPAGKVAIGDEVFDAISEGEFIEKGTAVYVHEVRANTIVVAKEDA